MQEQRIRSLGELIDAVTPREPDPVTGRRRDAGVYHGVSFADRPLLTSLDRLGGVDPPHTKKHLEAHILRNFARYSRPHLPAPISNDWELLVIAQHHGVPTRLLDWSYSPLVAAHFATANAVAGRDCAVWRLDWQVVHKAFGFQGLALLIQDLMSAETFGAGHPVMPWDLFRGPERDFAALIEPPSLNDRIVAQAAAFTICSDTSQSFDAFLEKHDLGRALTKLVIPAEAVRSVRDQLDMAGIEEKRLFPGLDGVAASIRRYYA
ncbi:MAG TPA: FRG domain-containing protein [Rhodothermales bacterium]